MSINRYICIYLYCRRASSSAAKRLACQVAKAVDGAAGSRVAVALAQTPTGKDTLISSDDVSIPLAANGQASWFIDEVFTGADTSDFVGSVRCIAPGDGMFTGVALELDAVNRIFTTLPVVPVPERMSRE